MVKPRFVVGMLSGGLMAAGVGLVYGENYPNKPIRIVTAVVGGAYDFQTRLIALGLTNKLGQQVVVDNRPAFVDLALIVARAPPDGYTLLSSGTPIWLVPLLQKTPYDPVTDFSPISLIARSINVLVVHPSVAAKSVQELIALAKAKPGALNYASGGTGGGGHLTGELFKAMAGVNIVHVPYKGGTAALGDLMAGQVHMTFDNPTTMMPLVKAGKLRALAVTSAEPSELVPGLPTVAATLPGFESAQLTGIFAPAKTPGAIIKRLNQEIVRVLDTAEVKEKFSSRGIEALYSSPEEFAAVRRSDAARWAKVIKDAGIKID